jgi:hypothetical protein
MGLIIKDVDIAGDKDRMKVRALFDSGASASFLRRDIAEKVATVLKMTKVWEFTLGDNKTRLQAECLTGIDITVKDWTIFDRVLVIDQLTSDLVIGADIMQRWKIKLDLETEDILIDKKVFELRL